MSTLFACGFLTNGPRITDCLLFFLIMPKRAQSYSSQSSGSDSNLSDSSDGSDVPQPRGRSKRQDRLVIRVHNLTKNVTIKHVREIFGRFGNIEEIEGYEDGPICDFPKGRSTIEFSSNDEAIEAFANMKGAQIDGIHVLWDCGRPLHSCGGCRTTARGEGWVVHGSGGTHAWVSSLSTSQLHDYRGCCVVVAPCQVCTTPSGPCARCERHGPGLNQMPLVSCRGHCLSVGLASGLSQRHEVRFDDCWSFYRCWVQGRPGGGGGAAGRSDSQWASRAPEELRKMVSAHRGWGTQRANPLGPLQRNVFVRPRSGELASSEPPLGPLMSSVEPPVRAGDQAPKEPTLGPLRHSAVVRLRPGDPAPSGPLLGPTEAQRGRLWTA